jgi:hypothetical protein
MSWRQGQLASFKGSSPYQEKPTPKHEAGNKYADKVTQTNALRIFFMKNPALFHLKLVR